MRANEAEAFFSSQVASCSRQTIFNMQLKRPQVARPHFLAAQAELRKVAKPDNALFQAIGKRLAETKP